MRAIKAVRSAVSVMAQLQVFTVDAPPPSSVRPSYLVTAFRISPRQRR